MASDDLVELETQLETTMLCCAQQVDSFVQHALGTTGMKAVTENVDISATPSLLMHFSDSMCEAVRLLHFFDISAKWGTTQSCTPAKRIHQLMKLGREPTAWVETILCMHPELADI